VTEDIGYRVKRIWESCVSYYAPFNEASERELAFALKLRHYLNDNMATLDQRQVKFKGRELAAKLRRKVADTMAAPIYIDALPVDSGEDPFTAEDVKFALEKDVRDPLKGFKTYLERMVLGAYAARSWWLLADFDPDDGQFGEITFRNGEPSKCFICPPYQDVWDKRNPYFGEECQELLSNVRRMAGWKNTDQLTADNSQPVRYPVSDEDSQGRIFRGEASSVEPAGSADGIVTILKWWFKRDPDKKTKRKVVPGSSRALPTDQQHYGCIACGYREPINADVPDQGSGICPTCMDAGQPNPLHLITHEVLQEESLAYPDGRLVIVAPYCNVVLYDGPWPYACRSFPAMQFKCYEHPRDPVGLSDTALDKHVQIVSNALMRRAYDSIMAAPNIILMPQGGGLKNSNQEPFQLTDEPWQVAYFEDSSGQMGQNIQHFQANPIPNSLFSFYGLVQQSFRADIGTAEVSTGGTSEGLKGVPVGTVKSFVESGNIPTDHHIRRLREELSIFFSVVHDMQRATWTAAKWVRIKGPDGLMSAKRMRGANLPGADIVVSAEPELKALDKATLETVQFWVKELGASETSAELLHIPPTIARKMKAEVEQRMQQAGAGMPPGAPVGAPPGTAPGPAAPNGAGVPPQLAAMLAARMRGGPVPNGMQSAA
jgi:hypothetical protein